MYESRYVMRNEQIRKKILETNGGQGALIGFENKFGEVEFYKGDFFSVFPKGSDACSDNALTTLPMYSVNGLIAFMAGALAPNSIKMQFEKNKKNL